ncbi:MAG: NAD-dependent epimerase/dehydratase family protein [Planctomycetota bacterium]
MLRPSSSPLRAPAADRRRPILPPGATVVVTGGAGFVGSHLAEALLLRGHAVHVVDDLSTGRLDNLAAIAAHPALRVTVGSVADPQVAAPAVGSADAVFHLAGVVGVQKLAAEPLAVMQRNLHATEQVLTAAAAAGVPVLFTSSSEVYGDGRVPFCEEDPVRPGTTEGLRGGYACAKAMGEWLAFGHAHQSSLPVVVARLFNTVGPRQSGEAGMVLPRFVRQAVRGEAITVYGDGAQTRCFAHVGDVVAALIDLASVPAAVGRVFNVGSDAETSVLALAELVRERAGSNSPIVRVPFAEVFPRGFVDPMRRVPSLVRLRAAIGRAPATPLPAIVDELIACVRAGQPAAGIAAR